MISHTHTHIYIYIHIYIHIHVVCILWLYLSACFFWQTNRQTQHTYVPIDKLETGPSTLTHVGRTMAQSFASRTGNGNCCACIGASFCLLLPLFSATGFCANLAARHICCVRGCGAKDGFARGEGGRGRAGCRCCRCAGWRRSTSPRSGCRSLGVTLPSGHLT